MAPAQLFGWRSKAIKSGAVTPQRDADRLGFVEVTQAASSTVEICLGRCGHSGRRRRRPGSFGQDYPGGPPGMIPAGVKVLGKRCCGTTFREWSRSVRLPILYWDRRSACVWT
ncbi:hypothetical protein [Mesorhizobium sp. M0684]|uniref:hypothetical protein n=1 Tax=Mesorhizobium sp. M0684 TaxID=2956986 RepID=UPI00333CAB51